MTIPNPSSDASWLANTYKEELKRAVGKEGLNYWGNELKSGRQSRDQVLANIRRSEEYKKLQKQPKPTPIQDIPIQPTPVQPAPTPTPATPVRPPIGKTPKPVRPPIGKTPKPVRPPINDPWEPPKDEMPAGWGGAGTPPRPGESWEDYDRRMEEIEKRWKNQLEGPTPKDPPSTPTSPPGSRSHHPDFTPPSGIATQAFEDWFNTKTGESYSTSSGGWRARAGSGWIRKHSQEYADWEKGQNISPGGPQKPQPWKEGGSLSPGDKSPISIKNPEVRLDKPRQKSGVGDEDYRRVHVDYADPSKVSAEQHRINQKDSWDRATNLFFNREPDPSTSSNAASSTRTTNFRPAGSLISGVGQQSSKKSSGSKLGDKQVPYTNDWGSYTPGSSWGQMVNQGIGNIVSWANQNPDNKQLGALTSGAIFDANNTLANMGLDLQYQRGQMLNMAEYHGGMENLRTGNTLKLMAAEGDITGQLIGQQGRIGSRQIGEKGDQDRRTLRVTGAEQRHGMREKGSEDRMTWAARGMQDRLLTKTKGSEDRLSRREQGAQDRMLTQEKGSEDRKTQQQRFREERKMRADARGAIRGEGSRFFG